MEQQFLYNRLARVRVGREGEEGIDFQGLRTQFSVEKTSESNSNTSKISVFNLSKSSRAFVEQEKQVLILEVGYKPPGNQGFLEQLCSGDVKKVTNQRMGVDWMTTFELGDAERKLQETPFDKTYDSGATLKQAISEVSGAFGLPVNSIIGSITKTFNSPLTLSGSAKKLMDDLTAEAGLEWSIQDGEVQIIGPESVTAEEAVLISPSTGLLNSPVKREKGIQFTSLIVPRLRPGRQVKLESESFTGFYRVRKANFQGDTHEGQWTVEVEATEVKSA